MLVGTIMESNDATFFLKGKNCEAKAPQQFIEPNKKY
jgi:hypothetical protein